MRSSSSKPCRPGHTPGIRAALELLFQASRQAEDHRCSIWARAVPITRLRAARVTNDELRWLVRTGHVECAIVVRAYGEKSQSFRRNGHMVFTPKTCFVLTVDGIALAH